MSEHKYDPLDSSDAEQNYSLMSNGSIEPKTISELNTHIQNVLQNVQDKFQAMANQINSQMDDSGVRVDDLEKTIADVMTQSGMELTL